MLISQLLTDRHTFTKLFNRLLVLFTLVVIIKWSTAVRDVCMHHCCRDLRVWSCSMMVASMGKWMLYTTEGAAAISLHKHHLPSASSSASVNPMLAGDDFWGSLKQDYARMNAHKSMSSLIPFARQQFISG